MSDVHNGTPPAWKPRDREAVTLLDRFAMAALQGLIAAYSGADVPLPDPETAARTCYDYADAMRRAREAK